MTNQETEKPTDNNNNNDRVISGKGTTRENVGSAKSLLPPLTDKTHSNLNMRRGESYQKDLSNMGEIKGRGGGDSGEGGGEGWGGGSKTATRENTKTEVQSLGLGKKTATLFLSRNHSMMKGRTSSQAVRASRDNTNLHKSQSALDRGSRQGTNLTSDGNDANGVDEELMKLTELEELQREFTFTGYEIDDDVAPREDVTPEGLGEDELLRRRYSQIYVNSCHKLGIHPAKPIADSLTDSHVVLKTRGLGVKGARAIAIALVGNKRVRTLDLRDNWIGADGAVAIASMTQKNDVITDINIGENRIGTKGARAISEAMCNNRNIRRLDLSGSNLFDHDARYVGYILDQNFCLQELIVAHNKFGELGGMYLGPAIANNETLQILDLSWNHLRGKGAQSVAAGIGENVALKVIDISWNGFCARACKIMGNSLKDNNSLRELDLSNNRLDTEAIGGIMKGMQTNQTLTSLRLGNNPYTPDVATIILKTIIESESSQVRELDLTDIVIEEEFLKLKDSLKDNRLLLVKHGPLIKKGETVIREADAISGFTDPVQALYEYMSQKGYRVIDLFKRFDTDRSMSVTRDEFYQGLVQAHVPMTVGQLEELMEKLDSNKDGSVDLKELMDGEKLFRRKSIRKKLRRQSKDKSARQRQRAGSLPDLNIDDKRRSSIVGLPSLAE